jgi:hypothetical protein
MPPLNLAVAVVECVCLFIAVVVAPVMILRIFVQAFKTLWDLAYLPHMGKVLEPVVFGILFWVPIASAALLTFFYIIPFVRWRFGLPPERAWQAQRQAQRRARMPPRPPPDAPDSGGSDSGASEDDNSPPDSAQRSPPRSQQRVATRTASGTAAPALGSAATRGRASSTNGRKG